MADAALAAGGHVTGVIPDFLNTREIEHPGLSKIIVVKSMHERKTVMADLSDAFIALPGGFGTFEELFEVTTWTQLGLQNKPVGLLNVDQFYQPLIHFLDQATQAGFIRPESRKIISHTSDISTLIRTLNEAELKNGEHVR